MSNELSSLRPAMTAVAAFIALSSTPLMAQVADASAASPAPVIAAPPPPVMTPAPDAAAPAAPVDTAIVAPAPTPAMRTIGTPVEHTEVTPAPVDAAAAPRTTRSAANATRPASVAARSTASPQVAKLAAPVAAPVATPTAAPAIKSAAPAVKAAPLAPATTVSTSSRSSDNDALPIAGAVGIGILALGAAAVAFGRRRREDGDAVAYEFADDTVVTTPPEPTPAYARRTAAPVAAVSGAQQLSSGFDLSRFGRHTQAAYRGPTADNPSHSLRRRLKRASFFDQREREAGEAGRTPQMREPVYAAAKAQQAEQDGQITVRLAPQRATNRFGYFLGK